jgi:hypothetical protein
MSNNIQCLLSLSKRSRLLIDSQDEESYAPAPTYLLTISTSSTMASPPIPPGPSQSPKVPHLDLVRPISKKETSPPKSQATPLLSSSEMQRQYAGGRYFGIPVGQSTSASPNRSQAFSSSQVEQQQSSTKQSMLELHNIEETFLNESRPHMDISSASKETPTVEISSRWSSSSSESFTSGLTALAQKINLKYKGSPIQEGFLMDNVSDNYASPKYHHKSHVKKDVVCRRVRHPIYNYTYSEFTSEPTVIIRGGFEGTAKADDHMQVPMPVGLCFNRYPPLSNEDYELTSDGRDPKFVYTAPVYTPLTTEESVLPIQSTILPEPREVIQQIIHPQLMNRFQSPVSCPIHYTLYNARQHTGYNDMATRLLGAAIGDCEAYETRDQIYANPLGLPPQLYLYCWRCSFIHIPPGDLEDLPNRDTCGSYLPDWLPAKKCTDPWHHFRDIWKDICHRVGTGLPSDYDSFKPTEKQSTLDKKWHTTDHKWQDIHPELSGFWRCNKGPKATVAELSCAVCHVPKVFEQYSNDHPHVQLYNIRRDALITWVHGTLRRFGADDEAAAVGIVNRISADRILSCPYLPVRGKGGRESFLITGNFGMDILYVGMAGNHTEPDLQVVVQSMEFSVRYH